MNDSRVKSGVGASSHRVSDPNALLREIYAALTHAADCARELASLETKDQTVRTRRSVVHATAQARGLTEELQRVLRRRAIRIAGRYDLPNSEAAEDIFQEMFFEVLKTFGPGATRGQIVNLNGYWSAIVHRRCLHRTKRARRLVEEPIGADELRDDSELAERYVNVDALRSLLKQCFDVPADAVSTVDLLRSETKLHRCFAVLVLHTDGWSYGELAHEAGRPESTIRGWRQHATDHLATRLHRMRDAGDSEGLDAFGAAQLAMIESTPSPGGPVLSIVDHHDIPVETPGGQA